MQHLKTAAVVLVCAILLAQTHCAALHPQSSELTRLKRMTPFWRGVTRPVGASCRDDSECFSRLCRTFSKRFVRFLIGKLIRHKTLITVGFQGPSAEKLLSKRCSVATISEE